MTEITSKSSATGQDAFDARLRAGLVAVQPPPGLEQRLLQVPDTQRADREDDVATAASLTTTAANEPQILRRLLPAAAALLLAIGIGLYYQPDLNAALASEVFGHIYYEEPVYSQGPGLSMAEVNARLQPVTGTVLQADDAEALGVTFAKDCYIAKQRTLHLVVKGETGPVNIMMIPDRVVDREVTIADQHFNGLVSPASGGTLVVVGNKQEPLRATRDRLASSLHWDY